MASMEKKRWKKPKHSLDAHRNRRNGIKSGDTRSGATVRRLKMYKTRPKRNSKGKILKNEFQSKDLPSTRIQPDPRWFGNTKVISQKELEFFREQLQSRMSNSYNVILRDKKLPMSLLNDHPKQRRAHLLDMKSCENAFIPKTKRESPKVNAMDSKADSLQVEKNLL